MEVMKTDDNTKKSNDPKDVTDESNRPQNPEIQIEINSHSIWAATPMPSLL